MSMLRRNARIVLFVLGCGLLTLNFWGFFRTMREPGVQAMSFHAHDVSLTQDELRARLSRRPAEADSAYIVRLNEAVNQGMAHYWGDEVDKYHLRVPIWENYLLYFGSFIRPDLYRKYEFVREDKAMERGMGLCSQQAVVLTQLLHRAGISAELQGLDGHVIVRATDRRGRVYMADPDYGVAIPASIAAIERDPDIVRPYYRKAGLRPADLDKMVAIYGPEGNREETIPEYFYQKIYYAEKAAYLLKWLLPLLLVTPYLLDLLSRRNVRP